MDSTTPSRLTDLVNIGKLTEDLLVEVGISTPQELQAVGAVEAWRRIQSRHPVKGNHGLFVRFAKRTDTYS